MNRALTNYAGMSVLVVNNNPADLAFMQQLLLRHGLERVHTESDARKVHRLLGQYKPDLVVLALRMAHLDGFDVLAQIRRYAAGDYLPVMVVTGDVSPDSRHRALLEGAQDFLTKPVDGTEVVLRIANLLHTRQLYATLRYLTSVQTLPGGERAEVMARIEGVLNDRTLTHVFQPIQDLTTGTIVGHEALARFPDLGFGGPDRWFADAFNVGLGVELEKLAALSALSYFDTAPEDTFLTVNMSPATVMALVDEELCPPELCPRIVIELSEQVPVQDYPALERALAPLRSHGARLSADDLGSGYAGFRHLIRLQPDFIKLDISLISGIHRNHEKQALTRALLAFAYEVGAQVVAEGIEEEGELATLTKLGVTLGQGYLIGRPAPLAWGSAAGPTTAPVPVGSAKADLSFDAELATAPFLLRA